MYNKIDQVLRKFELEAISNHCINFGLYKTELVDIFIEKLYKIYDEKGYNIDFLVRLESEIRKENK